MKLPMISIITPTFNAASTIENNLLSIVNQKYKVVEHLIIDGYSDDGTVSIIRNLQKQYGHIRLISEKDNGIYDAINKGMDLCSGDWIIIMGADDEFYNEHVLADLVGQGCLNDEQIVYGNVLIRGDAPWAKDNSIYDGPFTLEKLFMQNICHQSIFYPRSVIKKVGYYNQKYTTTADWDYNLRCYAKYKFSHVDKIISVFQTGGRSSQEGDIIFDAVFPEKIIEYFQLDLDDESIHRPGSPFYYPLSRHRKEKDHKEKIILYEERKALFKDREYLRNQIASLQIENNATVLALKSEHSSFVSELEARHYADISQLKNDFNNTMLKMKDDNLAIVSKQANDFQQVILNLESELRLLQSSLLQKEEEVQLVKKNTSGQIENLNTILETKESQLKEHANSTEHLINSLKQTISEKEHEILVIFNSVTWKTGKALLSPIQFFLQK